MLSINILNEIAKELLDTSKILGVQNDNLIMKNNVILILPEEEEKIVKIVFENKGCDFCDKFKSINKIDQNVKDLEFDIYKCHICGSIFTLDQE